MQNERTYDLKERVLRSNREVIEAQKNLQPAKIPFLPLLEKVAEKFVLYGVLSLLNRTCAVSKQCGRPWRSLGRTSR
jgi:hypothetical protein